MIDLDAVLAAIERAYTEVGEVAKQGADRRWRMSIPANRERDSDLLIANALDAGRLMAAELRAAREVVKAVRTHENWGNWLAEPAQEALNAYNKLVGWPS
jgi:hypothetical protein